MNVFTVDRRRTVMLNLSVANGEESPAYVVVCACSSFWQKARISVVFFSP
jgi:hypothetical protein